MTETNLRRRAAELAAEIVQLQSQWPKHSVPPALIIQLEDLEEALEQVHAAIAAADDPTAAESGAPA